MSSVGSTSTSPVPPSTPPLLEAPLSDSDAAESSSAARKARRQTAVYPAVHSGNKVHKPFSRSAAKRESVMQLGSIEHLQHYFTKTGLSAKQNPLKPSSNLVPAIGGLSINTDAHQSHIPHLELPPSPAVPIVIQPPPSKFERSQEVDHDALRSKVVHELDDVSLYWDIDRDSGSSKGGGLLTPRVSAEDDSVSRTHFDILSGLKVTTKAIRTVRNYLLSLPDDSAALKPSSHTYRPSNLSPARPVRQSRGPLQSTISSDRLSVIRRAALTLLAVLRRMEETYRLPLSDDAYDKQSDRNTMSPTRFASPSGMSDETSEYNSSEPSFAFSVVQVPGRPSIPVWEDEEQDFNAEEDKNVKEIWDDRLGLGSGWLYRQNVTLEDLKDERAAIARYLDDIDEVLFGGTKDEVRGWRRLKRDAKLKRRRASTGEDSDSRAVRIYSPTSLEIISVATFSEEPDQLESVTEEEEVDDSELPAWAVRTSFVDEPMRRVHALMSDVLTPELLQYLADYDEKDNTQFLKSLSSGQLLCAAFNVAIWRSRRPWGLIDKDAIHNIGALEAEYFANPPAESEQAERTRKGWTFRRTDNLRLWAAALKLRYMLPVMFPSSKVSPDLRSASSTPATSPQPNVTTFAASGNNEASSTKRNSESPILFDAGLVARRDLGWEAMLQMAILQWARVVTEEKRGER